MNTTDAEPSPPVKTLAPTKAPLLPAPFPITTVPVEPATWAITSGESVPLVPLKPPRLRTELLPSTSVATSPGFWLTVTTVVPCSVAPDARASVPEFTVVMPE